MSKKIILRLFFTSVIITLVGLGGYRGVTRLAPDSVVVSCRHIYSDDLKEDVVQFVADSVSREGTRFDPEALSVNLKDRFRFVEKVSFHWDASGRAVVAVEGVRPEIFVNDEFVLGDERRIFCAQAFEKFPSKLLKPLGLDFLMECTVAPQGRKIPKHVHKFLQSVPDSCWDRYTVSYSGDHVVYDDSKFRLVVDMNTLADQKKMDIVQFIHDDFVKQKKRALGSKTVAYDLRFKNCVCARIAQQ